MQIFVIIIDIVILIWIQFTVSFQGLDLRKRSDWLYVMFGFLSGLMLSTAVSSKFIDSLGLGVIVAFLTLFAGVTSHRHKQKYGGMAATRSSMRKYEKDHSSSLLGKLIKKLLDKQN